MKRNAKFLTIVILSLLISSIALNGCMKFVSDDKGESKPYDLENFDSSLDSYISEDAPETQFELSKKFSDMYEISQSGKSITIISQNVLEEYWNNESTPKKALTPTEVLFIVQDSIRIYFEYDEYVLLSNEAFAKGHQKLSEYYDILGCTIKSSTNDKEMLENNFDIICKDIYDIIIYRLAVLSPADAFIFADDAIRFVGQDLVEYNSTYPETIYYIPEYPNKIDMKDWFRYFGGTIDRSDYEEWAPYFDIRVMGGNEIEFVDLEKTTGVFPTQEMHMTQVNRVISVVDRTETEGIPTDTAEEPFYEDDRFIYLYPSIRSEYVIAKLYDGRTMTVKEALEQGYMDIYELEDWGVHYIRKVKREINDGPYWSFDYQTVYTDKQRNDGIYPYANIFNSYDELKSYITSIKEKNVYATDIAKLTVPSFDEWIISYNYDWFEERSLIIVVVESDSEILPEIKRVQVDTHVIDITLDEESLGTKNDQVYTIFLEIDKTEVDKTNVLDKAQ